MSTSPTTTEKMELSEEDRRVQGEMELNKVSETLVYHDHDTLIFFYEMMKLTFC